VIEEAVRPAFGAVASVGHERGELGIRHRAPRDGEHVHVDRARRVVEERVTRWKDDDVGLGLSPLWGGD
jgi:hypothetical protein